MMGSQLSLLLYHASQTPLDQSSALGNKGKGI